MYAITICEKGGHECEEEVVGCFKGREGMEKCSNYILTTIPKKKWLKWCKPKQHHICGRRWGWNYDDKCCPSVSSIGLKQGLGILFVYLVFFVPVCMFVILSLW